GGSAGLEEGFYLHLSMHRRGSGLLWCPRNCPKRAGGPVRRAISCRVERENERELNGVFQICSGPFSTEANHL
ncbi:hypothetical protein PF011_g32238, partial [Phytophthora fragariae]